MRFELLNPMPKVCIPDSLPFGRTKTNHFVVCDYKHASGWQEPVIKPLEQFQLSPSSVVFHYGQQIFEGLKAYRGPADEVFLFRVQANAERLYRSAERLAMEPVPKDVFVSCVRELVRVEKDWIPPSPGALYIRPMLIPLDEGVSYRASLDYRFCVVVCPVESYFGAHVSLDGITVAVEREFSRAAPGGVGDAKCGGNYASALLSVKKARARGATDVMWLDPKEHKYVEEVGTMNLFFYDGKTLMTPELSGSILPGITRDSLIQLGRHLGIDVQEKRISIDDVLDQARRGVMKEVFGCGTAVVVCPIGKILDGTSEVKFSYSEDSLSTRLRKHLYELQSGRAPDPFHWREVL